MEVSFTFFCQKRVGNAKYSIENLSCYKKNVREFTVTFPQGIHRSINVFLKNTIF